jgi:anthranilate phosphoribosyltransferase
MNTGVDFPSLLKRTVRGEILDAADAGDAFAAIMAGQVSETRIASFLTALAFREPSIDEILGAARAMRASMLTVDAPAGAIDVCGTGGDGHATLNVSTAVAFVVAACGVPVAKHGNRNISSRTGAADVLEALGVRIDISPHQAQECLRGVGLCFLFAPAYHPAMKHVAIVRRELGFRTIFNLLGPIANPASVRRQLVGVFSESWLEPLAKVLAQLGTEKAWIVHGRDGLDELTTSDATAVASLNDGHISRLEVNPEELGLKRVALAALKGGTPADNACAIRALFAGAPGPFRDIVLLNSAAAMIVAGRARELPEGIEQARQALDSGQAAQKLDQLAAATQRVAA